MLKHAISISRIVVGAMLLVLVASVLLPLPWAFLAQQYSHTIRSKVFSPLFLPFECLVRYTECKAFFLYLKETYRERRIL